uniref:Uncharacterized protein n=1 Tax=Schistocephalus solidus TaxID=70667 RepID=A0A0V0J794_SCHSO
MNMKTALAFLVYWQTVLSALDYMDVYVLPVTENPYGGYYTVADGYSFYKLCNSKYMVVKNTENCITFLMRNGMLDVEKNLEDKVRFKFVFCYNDAKPTEAPTTQTTKNLLAQWDLL